MGPTFLGLAGLAKPSQMDGKSLVPFLVKQRASDAELLPSTRHHLAQLGDATAYAAGWRDSVRLPATPVCLHACLTVFLSACIHACGLTICSRQAGDGRGRDTIEGRYLRICSHTVSMAGSKGLAPDTTRHGTCSG